MPTVIPLLVMSMCFKSRAMPKSTKLDLAIGGQKQIAGLQITMDHTVVVRELECRTELSSDLDDGLPGQGTFVLQQRLDRTAVDQFHHVVQQAVVFTATVVVHDMGMVQPIQDQHLATKAGADQSIRD